MIQKFNLDTLLEQMRDKPEFILIDKGWYQIVDYVYVDKDTFNHPLLCEGRGIKFDTDGEIIARPFHKFFNLGEKLQVHEINWQAGHITTLKLDGSMIHTVTDPVGMVVAMTRKGYTDIAEKVQDLFFREGDNYAVFSAFLMDAGYTPLFEYTAPDNRIVIPYDKPMLTLLAARHMESGAYMPRVHLEQYAANQHVPVVRKLYNNAHDLLITTRNSKDEEGIVIHFDNDLMLKVKAEDYVMKHRALNDLASKKKVLALVFADGVDDLLPLLGELDRSELLAFRDGVNRQVTGITKTMARFVLQRGDQNRKDYAADVKEYISKNFRQIAFAAYDEKEIREATIRMLSRNPDEVQVRWRNE